MKSYKGFITEVNKHREKKLNYQYGERNKPENYLPNDPVKDALNKKLKTAQIVPTKSNNPIDTRTTEEKGKNVKGKAYTAKMTNTWDKFKAP
jgi:hypothetical protein